MSRIQREPQGHSTPLTLGDRFNTMGVFFPCPKADHTATLRAHLSLEKSRTLNKTINRLTLNTPASMQKYQREHLP